MNKPAVIQSILEAHTIVDYLQSQGHDPVRAYGTRHVYSCPLHGPEKDPSFYVFSNKEYQYYHCFGCKKHGDVINLVTELENVDLKKAIGRLARGMDIAEEGVLERYAEEMNNAKSKTNYELEDLAIRLACTFRSYLKEVNFDPEEVVFMEQVFTHVDSLIVALDIEELRNVYELVVDQGIPKRVEVFTARKEAEAASKYIKTAYAT